MDTANLSNFFKTARAAMVKHSPKILTGIGIVGMVGTTVMAVKATPRAIELLNERKVAEHTEKLPPIEVVKTTWKCYVPATITGVTSVACLLKANSISTRRNAALVTAYNLSKTAFADYKEKVIETFGEKKEQVVMDKIAKDKIEKDPVTSHEVIITDKNRTSLFYDGAFGRYFMSDRDTIARAEHAVNRMILTNMYVSLNEFYSEIGLSPVDMGDKLGWNVDDGEILVYYSAQIASNGEPCTVITFNVSPDYNYSSIV